MGIYLIKYQINNNMKDTIYYKIFRIFFMILSDDFFSHICLHISCLNLKRLINLKKRLNI